MQLMALMLIGTSLSPALCQTIMAKVTFYMSFQCVVNVQHSQITQDSQLLGAFPTEKLQKLLKFF